MEIYLMQHGESYPKEEDPERRLTPGGEEQFHLSGKALKQMDLHFDCIISSPKKRAKQTAEIIATELGFPQDEINVTESLEPKVSAEDALSYLQSRTLKKNRVFLAGHLPSLGEIASALLSERSQISLHFEMGGAMRIDVEKLQHGRGHLRWLLTPDQLALLARTR